MEQQKIETNHGQEITVIIKRLGMMDEKCRMLGEECNRLQQENEKLKKPKGKK